MMNNSKLLSKIYNTKKIENYWYNIWQKENLFHPIASDSLPKENPIKESYVIMMPPPNITGILHNGHALFVTLEDILARYHRMNGKNVLWLPGIDHAGITTQSIVERDLILKTNKTKEEIGKKEFIKKIWQWKRKNEFKIIEQLKILGASADWSRSRFTLDDKYLKSVKKAFVKMWDDKLIYRGKRLVNWDTEANTALSDEEVNHIKKKIELYFFAYKIKNEEKSEIIVATTRIETMLGDTAIAVNPNDNRYIKFIGKNVIHPFFSDRKIEIIADNYVDMKFGTGAVKVSPAHDQNDFLMAKKHNLKIINILTFDGKINENGKIYSGLSQVEAKIKIKKDLMKIGLFRGIKEIESSVMVSQRSNTNIEPMISRQYFIKTKTLADLAIKEVENKKTKILPKNFEKIWNHFLLNIQDWCISRQLWWGHKIPIFYNIKKMKKIIIEDSDKKKYITLSAKAIKNNIEISKILKIALNELDDNYIRKFSKASIEDLSRNGESKIYVQEEDVLDTWFSSGIWPFASLGWPEKTEDLRAFYPGTVLETGSDILFFWVARMMMLGIYFMGKAPFKDIFLHPMIRDSSGRKMSKSLGNVIDPIDVIRGITLNDLLLKIKSYPIQKKMLPRIIREIKVEYPNGIPESGADGLRISLAILSGQGENIKLSIPRINGYRSFLNKIWNATRFTLMNTKSMEPIIIDEETKELKLEDTWILSKTHETIKKTKKNIEKYNFSEAANAIYHFFWTDFCDWYLEFAKVKFKNNDNINEQINTHSILIKILEITCRLLHPFCPYITEEIWQKLPLSKEIRADIKFCAKAKFPKWENKLINKDAENKINLIKKSITMIRNTKQIRNLSIKNLKCIILLENLIHIKLFNKFKNIIIKMTNLKILEINLRSKFKNKENFIINSCSEFDIIIPMKTIMNDEKEKNRLKNNLNKIIKKILLINKQLENKQFIKLADKEIVEKTKIKFLELKKIEEKIKEALMKLK